MGIVYMVSFNENDFEEVSCLLCGGTSRAVFNEAASASMHRVNVICEPCGFVFTSPRLREEISLRYYQDEYVRDFYGVKGEADIPEVLSWRGRRANDKIGYFPEYFEKYTNVFEVGVGTGIFLKRLREAYGAAVFGVEPSASFARIARRHCEVPVFEGTIRKYFDEYGDSRRYTMIVMDQVLEHVYDPIGTLRIVHDLLFPEGFVYIGVPNLANPAHPREEFFIPPHIFSFTPRTIAAALERAHLKIVKLYAPERSPMHLIAARTDNPASSLPPEEISGPLSKEDLTRIVDSFQRA